MADASPPEIAPLPAVMSTEEVSELLGLTPKWTLRLAREGHLPGHQVPNGRRWVFLSDEVLDAISSWSVERDVESGQPVDEPGPEASGSPTGPTAQPAPAPDPAAISCAAPPRSSDQDEAEWLGECVTAWMDAAAATGIRSERSGRGVCVNGSRHVVVVDHSEVGVVDDYGDETTEQVTLVRLVPEPAAD